jgi:hypothetical protein
MREGAEMAKSSALVCHLQCYFFDAKKKKKKEKKRKGREMMRSVLIILRVWPWSVRA